MRKAVINTKHLLKLILIIVFFSLIILQSLRTNYQYVPKFLHNTMNNLSRIGIRTGVNIFAHKRMNSTQIERCLALTDNSDRIIWTNPECMIKKYIFVHDSFSIKLNFLTYNITSPYWLFIGYYGQEQPSSLFFENYFKNKDYYTNLIKTLSSHEELRSIIKWRTRNIKIVSAISLHYCKTKNIKSIHGLIHLKFKQHKTKKIITENLNLFQFDCELRQIENKKWKDKTYLASKVFLNG